MSDVIDQKRWGICGFVSVLNGLRAAGQLTKLTGGGSTEMSLKEIQTRLYAEIVAYLKYLVFMESPLVAQIEDITRICSPKGTPKRNIQQIILFIEKRLRKIAASHGSNESSLEGHMRALIGGEKDNNITVAMTPELLGGLHEVGGCTECRPFEYNDNDEHERKFTGVHELHHRTW